MDMNGKEIRKFLKNEKAVADYRAGMDLLERSGILELLGQLTIPSMIGHGSDVQIMAAQAAWSNGCQTSLRWLKYFEEVFKHELDKEDPKSIAPDFGGDTQAIQRGHLTAEEVAKSLSGKVHPIK